MVWPNFFLMHAFFALKGSKLFTIISIRGRNVLLAAVSEMLVFPVVSFPSHVVFLLSGLLYNKQCHMQMHLA